MKLPTPIRRASRTAGSIICRATISAINFVDQTTTSESAFAQADFDIVKRLTLSGGVRYTHERKETDFERRVLVPGAFTGAFPAYAPFTLTRTENAVDGLVNLRYTASDDLMFYAAWPQGTKSGGFASVVGLSTRHCSRPRSTITGWAPHLSGETRHPTHPSQLMEHRCLRTRLGDGSIYHWEFDTGDETFAGRPRVRSRSMRRSSD